ncbi:MAG: nucleotide pyrophosphohydrolase [Myxococcales bacterium]|nr:nucleotide pyrophosphohydrolase [Myxococcales bacterium]
MPWSDDTTPIAAIRQRLAAFNTERDWAQYHSPRNLAMAVSVEAGELLALYLWSSDGGPQPAVASRSAQVEDEAADVLISLLNLCNVAGIDLAAAVDRKLARNAERYPVDVSRGRLEKYTELPTSGAAPCSATVPRPPPGSPR